MGFIAPKVYNWFNGVYMPFLLGFTICIVSWVAALCMCILDRKADSQEAEGSVAGDAKQKPKLNIRDMKKLSFLYFLIVFNKTFLYTAFATFTDNLNDILVKRFGFSLDLAGDYTPIIFILPLAIVPLFGILVDKVGQRPQAILFAAIVFFGVHLLTAFLPNAPANTPDYRVLFILVWNQLLLFDVHSGI